jgi:hypothetical protein
VLPARNRRRKDGFDARGKQKWVNRDPARETDLCVAHGKRRARYGSELLRKCYTCLNVFEDPEIKQGSILCPKCLDAIKCVECETPVVTKMLRQLKNPRCFECRTPRRSKRSAPRTRTSDDSSKPPG